MFLFEAEYEGRQRCYDRSRLAIILIWSSVQRKGLARGKLGQVTKDVFSHWLLHRLHYFSEGTEILQTTNRSSNLSVADFVSFLFHGGFNSCYC
jgi:hypothetical protein